MAKRRANGEGSIYKRKDGLWSAQYTDNVGKVRTLYGKTQQIVKDKLKEAIRLSDAGANMEPKKITFADWVMEWLDVYRKPFIRASSYSHIYRHVQLHIVPHFGKVQLKDIRPDMLQKFLNEKIQNRKDEKPGGYAPASCMKLKQILNGSLKKAVDLGYIQSNPAQKLQLPPAERTEKRILTIEQQKAFEEAVRVNMKSDHNASVLLLLLYTGMRIGEALGLRKDDIDFEKGELHVRRTVGLISKPSGGMEFYVGEPKTKESKRTIPLSPKVTQLYKRPDSSEGFTCRKLSRDMVRPWANGRNI